MIRVCRKVKIVFAVYSYVGCQMKDPNEFLPRLILVLTYTAKCAKKETKCTHLK